MVGPYLRPWPEYEVFGYSDSGPLERRKLSSPVEKLEVSEKKNYASTSPLQIPRAPGSSRDEEQGFQGDWLQGMEIIGTGKTLDYLSMTRAQYLGEDQLFLPREPSAPEKGSRHAFRKTENLEEMRKSLTIRRLIKPGVPTKRTIGAKGRTLGRGQTLWQAPCDIQAESDRAIEE
jgi:hypothetical protein